MGSSIPSRYNDPDQTNRRKVMKPLHVIVPTILLLLAGCDDSTTPLSAPATSKPDERLVGVWRLREKDGNVTYYHVGYPDESLPSGVMRVVVVTHRKQKLRQPIPVLVFPTTIGNKTYLNVTGQLIKVEKGWEAKAYFLFRYQVDGDSLLLSKMDIDAKETAIDSGKIKGVSDHEKSKKDWLRTVRLTDTTENLARFVGAAGDSLWSKPERLERVEAGPLAAAAGKHDEAEKQAIAAAKSWLGLTDLEKYGESWDSSADYLKNAVDKDDFVRSLTAARKPLGKMKSRELKSKEYRTSLPGAPDGEYVVIQFKTTFENKKSAIETITPMLGKDGTWKVSGYYIK
jgi:hypothetical protein